MIIPMIIELCTGGGTARGGVQFIFKTVKRQSNRDGEFTFK